VPGNSLDVLPSSQTHGRGRMDITSLAILIDSVIFRNIVELVKVAESLEKYKLLHETTK